MEHGGEQSLSPDPLALVDEIDEQVGGLGADVRGSHAHRGDRGIEVGVLRVVAEAADGEVGRHGEAVRPGGFEEEEPGVGVDADDGVRWVRPTQQRRDRGSLGALVVVGGEGRVDRLLSDGSAPGEIGLPQDGRVGVVMVGKDRRDRGPGAAVAQVVQQPDEALAVVGVDPEVAGPRLGVARRTPAGCRAVRGSGGPGR